MTPLLAHRMHAVEDGRPLELDDAGNVTWDWRAADRISELGFDAPARDRAPRHARRLRWLHINSGRYLEPNIPQLPTPREVAVTPPAPGTFDVPGAPEG